MVMPTSKRKVLSEDAFGTPPAARGSMMNVAGKTDDEVPPGDELLVDDDTMDGPVYPEALLRAYISDMLSEVIRKSGSGYALYTRHKKGGKRRKLGQHKSKAAAERQEKAIHAHGG